MVKLVSQCSGVSVSAVLRVMKERMTGRVTMYAAAYSSDVLRTGSHIQRLLYKMNRCGEL